MSFALFSNASSESRVSHKTMIMQTNAFDELKRYALGYGKFYPLINEMPITPFLSLLKQQFS